MVCRPQFHALDITVKRTFRSVTDRLAYLNFAHATLTGTLAQSLNSSRAPLKLLRDAENNLGPRRNVHIGLQTEIARIEHGQQKGMEKHLADLRAQLQRAEAEDAAAEREVEILKRRAVTESEQHKWAALREVSILGHN